MSKTIKYGINLNTNLRFPADEYVLTTFSHSTDDDMDDQPETWSSIAHFLLNPFSTRERYFDDLGLDTEVLTAQ